MMSYSRNYRHFSNGLALVLLGVYDSWGKLDTMGVTYSATYLGRLTSRKRMGAQNEKHPNRDMWGKIFLQFYSINFERVFNF